MNVTFDAFTQKFELNLHGAISHPVELGTGVLGNLQRIENALKDIPSQITAVKMELENLNNQVAAAEDEVSKPFPQEEALRTKSARLAELNIALNMDKGPDRDQQEDREDDSHVAKRSISPGLRNEPKTQEKKRRQEAR